MTDDELIMKIRSLPKADRGRVIQRALKVYFETAGGREVCELFKKGKTKAGPGDRKDKPSHRPPPGKLKDILGDY